jgi:hypothetical protein
VLKDGGESGGKRPSAPSRARAYNGPSPENPELWAWGTPAKSCKERLQDMLGKYGIRKDHVEPLPSPRFTRFKQNFLIWQTRSDIDRKWLEEYKTWSASVDGKIQAVPPQSDDIQPITTGALRGGAGSPATWDGRSPESEGSESEGEYGPTDRAPGGYEDLPDSHMPPGDDFVDSTEAYDYQAGSPRSSHSALSGYSSDLSRAASEAFHEQNERASTQDTTPAGQPSSESTSLRPGDGIGFSPRSPFSFETMPTSGSRSERISPDIDDATSSRSMDIGPYPSSASGRSGSIQDETTHDSADETEFLINPFANSFSQHLAANVPSGVPPFGYTYQVTAESPPAEDGFAPARAQSPPRRRRHNRLFHAIRRERLQQRLRENLTLALRNMLNVSPKSQKSIRKKER